MRKSLVVLFLVAAAARPALAASPFQTGSTSIAEGWELKSSFSYKDNREKEKFVLPAVELTAPVSDWQEASFEISRGMIRTKDGRTIQGLRDLEAGSKIRLFQGEKNSWIPTIAIEPTLVLPTGSVGRGLGDGEWRGELPVTLGWKMGAAKFYGQVGYAHGFGRNHGGTIPFGALLLYDLSDTFTIGAEIAGEHARDLDADDSTVANVGFQWTVLPNVELHAMVGRTLRNDDEPAFQTKLAVQVNF
jgi:hypothetical protein